MVIFRNPSANLKDCLRKTRYSRYRPSLPAFSVLGSIYIRTGPSIEPYSGIGPRVSCALTLWFILHYYL